jgi:hypothetical protein
MEKRKRVPVFILSWMTTYPWLQNGISGMTCTVCTQFDKTGTFITGCKNYKRDSINQHEKSESHKVNVIDYRRNDQSKAFADLSELLETES